jgi:hypothetical protein
MHSRTGLTAVLLAASLLSACASRSIDVRPDPVADLDLAAWPCDSLDDETERVQQRASDVAYAVDVHRGNNIIAFSVGTMVFWPALLAMRPDGPEATELAQLKGRYDALQRAARQQGCPPMADELPAARATRLPLRLGDRLVYDERSGHSGPSQELGLRLRALKRGELDFTLERGDRQPDVPWRQDAAGNLLSPLPQPLLAWSRLLRHDMALGDVLTGELTGPDADSRSGRLRGQVIALGPLLESGRKFDAATIELFGDVPNGNASSRVEGVMVVDRLSGVLLRLELRSINPDYALRRRLVRIEPAS